MIKNKWHDIIRNRLKENRKECLACLYPSEDSYEDSYEWGCCSSIGKKRTLVLLNNILKNIPIDAWSKDKEEGEYLIASNNWSIKLLWVDGRRSADLKFRNDDHTAWVREHRSKNGKFIDFDIGGS